MRPRYIGGDGTTGTGEAGPRPCPFCGSRDVDACPGGERADGRPWYAYYVCCNACGCSGPPVNTNGRGAGHAAAREASIGLWNRRANEND